MNKPEELEIRDISKDPFPVFEGGRLPPNFKWLSTSRSSMKDFLNECPSNMNVYAFQCGSIRILAVPVRSYQTLVVQVEAGSEATAAVLKDVTPFISLWQDYRFQREGRKCQEKACFKFFKKPWIKRLFDPPPEVCAPPTPPPPLTFMDALWWFLASSWHFKTINLFPDSEVSMEALLEALIEFGKLLDIKTQALNERDKDQKVICLRSLESAGFVLLSEEEVKEIKGERA